MSQRQIRLNNQAKGLPRMKLFQGTVTSTNMQKTIKVEVTRNAKHPLYKKIVKSTKSYLVHDETETAQVGDRVTFAETRPLSRRKRFTLVAAK